MTQPLTLTDRTRLEAVEGIVFDIQRYSVHDGPGLRTNVFLKGCPLRCGWCANPESQQMQPELALFEQNCMTCGQFETPCPVCRSENRNAELPLRVDICPTGAVHWIGRRRTAGDVMAEVRRDIPFYEDGGGLTLTGGEATMQPEMAEALLRLAKAEGINTAIETCGHSRWAVFERLVPYLDDVLYDLKHIDNYLHRQHTALGNELILDNLRRLVAGGAPVTVRVPLIPGFNADVDSVTAIARFVASLPGPVRGVDVLPYHSLGKAKYAALGRDYLWQQFTGLTDEEVAALAGIFETAGIPVGIGG